MEDGNLNSQKKRVFVSAQLSGVVSMLALCFLNIHAPAFLRSKSLHSTFRYSLIHMHIGEIHSLAPPSPPPAHTQNKAKSTQSS